MKKAAKEQALVPENWHPNFRDYESLPDIKAVRTGFFVSVVTSSIALAILLFVGINEYSKLALEASIQDLKAEVTSSEPRNKSVAQGNQEFLALAAKFDEIVNFDKGYIVTSDLLLDLSEALAVGMRLSSVELRADRIIVTGDIAAGAGEAASIVDEYIASLKANDIGQAKFDAYTLDSLDRSVDGHGVSFAIVISSGAQQKK